MDKLKKIVFVIISLGIMLRFLNWLLPVMDSDMAITGLMARHILKGEFPVFFWGQAYCGSIEAYLAALVFALFGASRYALNIVPVLESILFMLLMYLLAKRAFGRKTGILTLLLTAFPARYLVANAGLARANYVENLILGAVVFYLTYRMVFEKDGMNSRRRFFILGIFYGLAWWTNFQSIYFILTSLIFIFLRKKRIFFTQRFLMLVLGILIGGSPLWYYCFTHGFGLFQAVGANKFVDIGLSFRNFIIIGLPEIFGVIKSQPRTVFLPFISQALLGIYLFAFLYVVKERWRGLLYLGRLSLRKSNGMEMFIVFFILFALIYILSGYALINTRRYLLTLYSGVPISLAYFLNRFGQKHKKLSIFFLAIILAANLQQNIISIDIFDKGKRDLFFLTQKTQKEAFSFLEKKGIKHVYVNDYWRSYQYTFDAGEKIIFTEWNPSRYPPYFEAAQRSKNAAFYFPGDEKNFLQLLKNIGTESYKRKYIGGATLFYDFGPFKRNYEEIDLSKAKAFSNYNQGEVNQALDGNMTTRWTTKTAQIPGMYFELDLGKTEEVGRLMVELDGSAHDYPCGYVLSTSLNGKVWQDVVVSRINWGAFYYGEFHPIVDGKEAKLEICFEPHLARFVRLTQTGENHVWWWSMHEVNLYGPEPKEKSR